MQASEFRAQPGTLYIVATPIGNLRDITLRALDILKTADLVAAEDTRVSGGLLSAHGISARLFACHEHNERTAAAELVQRLQEGRSVALISDAGTPGISDPGAVVARAARAAGLTVVPIPGASAVAAALSAAGLAEGRWLFHGFLPHKTGERRRELETLAAVPQSLVFYESPHRLLETVADLAVVLGGERRLFIARELTKRFEELHECALAEAVDWLQGDENRRRGEFVLIVSGCPTERDDGMKEARRVLEILLEDLPASQAARLAARITGAKKNALYALAQELKPSP
ncbi:MAG: 16S rRNA (cytidine(1402)-2'-O)-methyltransferase [Thiobacillus sp.]|nr:16S rRNA (cytidine(1402)-2'-O)-methyltransferase [Thiobacillus sp.]